MTTSQPSSLPPNKDKFIISALWILIITWLMFCLASCNSVKKTQSERVTFDFYDTVRVTTYDTSKQVIETLDFQNKTIEIYDTVRITKDSIIYVLKTRTIYENGFKTKELNQVGKGKDSIKVVTVYKDVIKTVEKQSKRFPLTLVLGLVGIAALVLLFIYFKVKP